MIQAYHFLIVRLQKFIFNRVYHYSYIMNNTGIRTQGSANGAYTRTLPKLDANTNFNSWRNTVKKILEQRNETFEEEACLIICSMDNYTSYRAKAIITDLRLTAKNQNPERPIKTLNELLNRLDESLNGVEEINRARMELETIIQGEQESVSSYFMVCCDIWELAYKNSDNPPETPLISAFLSGLRNRTVAYFTRMEVKKAATPMTVSQVCAMAVKLDEAIRQEDLDYRKRLWARKRNAMD